MRWLEKIWEMMMVDHEIDFMMRWDMTSCERWWDDGKFTISSYHLFFFLFPHLSFHFHLKKKRWIFKWDEIRLRWERDGRWWDWSYYFFINEMMVGWLMIFFLSSFYQFYNHLIYFLVFFTISLFIYEMVDLLEMVGWSLWKTVKKMRWWWISPPSSLTISSLIHHTTRLIFIFFFIISFFFCKPSTTTRERKKNFYHHPLPPLPKEKLWLMMRWKWWSTSSSLLCYFFFFFFIFHNLAATFHTRHQGQ